MIALNIISTAIDVYTSSIGVFTDCSALYKLVKWSKTVEDPYQPPFYGSFEFTCLVSVHA